MNLINPLMGWGLLAVSIPIIIHILNRQRFKITDWAAIEFLRRALEKNRKRIKIQELILLALRCLAVALIAGMLMRPIPGDFNFGSSNRLRVLVLDSSASMAGQQSGETAWDRAIAGARAVVNKSSVKNDDRFMICTIGDSVDVELGATPDRRQVLDKLNSLQLHHRRSDYQVISKEVVRLMTQVSDASIREVFIFSDFQVTGMQSEQFPIEETNRETWWHFHDCGARERGNLAVTRMSILSSSVVKDRPVEIEVDVHNFSDAEQRTAVSLFDGADKRDSRQGVEVPPGSTTTVKFVHIFNQDGPRYLRASIDRDLLGVDNNHWLGLDVKDRIKVIVLDGDPGSVFYRDETFLYRNMLEVPGLFDVQVMRAGIDDYDNIDFADLQLLVCANTPTLSPQAVERLTNWVDEGGSLLVTAGSNFDPQGLAGLADILPVLPGEVHEFDQSVQAGLTPGQHAEQGMLQSFNTLQMSRIDKMLNVEAKDGARVIMRAATRYPLLVHHRHGSGQVAFWASSIDYEWCYFLDADYIGIFGLTSQTLVQNVLERITDPGSNVRYLFPTSAIGGDASLKDRTPNDAGDVNEGRHPLVVEEDGLTAEIVVGSPQIPTAGIYEIQARNGSTLGFMGVNAVENESDLEALADEELIGNSPNNYLSLSRDNAGLMKRLSDSYPGREIWRYLAMLLLAVLVIESFLATRWGNS